MILPASISQRLCLSCGLCCNGVLFKDVELQPGDDPEVLRALGSPVQAAPTSIQNPKSKIQNSKFPQPCVALEGCRCRIYARRPARCRQFECLLFKAVQAGQVEVPAALRDIRKALRQADEVRRLLRELGDRDEQTPLDLRFKRTRQRLENGLGDDQIADLSSHLSLAVHQLNLLLREKFYPGSDGG